MYHCININIKLLFEVDPLSKLLAKHGLINLQTNVNFVQIVFEAYPLDINALQAIG